MPCIVCDQEGTGLPLSAILFFRYSLSFGKIWNVVLIGRFEESFKKKTVRLRLAI